MHLSAIENLDISRIVLHIQANLFKSITSWPKNQSLTNIAKSSIFQ